MSNQELIQQLNELSRRNGTLHNALMLAEIGQVTYEEALQIAVCQLVAINDSLQLTLMKNAMRLPSPITKGAGRDD